LNEKFFFKEIQLDMPFIRCQREKNHSFKKCDHGSSNMAAIISQVNRDTLKMIVYEEKDVMVCNNLIIMV